MRIVFHSPIRRGSKRASPGCNGKAVLSLRLGLQPDKGKFEKLGVFLAEQACCETDSFPSCSCSGSALHSECVTYPFRHT